MSHTARGPISVVHASHFVIHGAPFVSPRRDAPQERARRFLAPVKTRVRPPGPFPSCSISRVIQPLGSSAMAAGWHRSEGRRKRRSSLGPQISDQRYNQYTIERQKRERGEAPVSCFAPLRRRASPRPAFRQRSASSSSAAISLGGFGAGLDLARGRPFDGGT